MKIGDFITYLSVELPKGYVIERQEDIITVYDNTWRTRGISFTLPSSLLEQSNIGSISVLSGVLTRAFTKASPNYAKT